MFELIGRGTLRLSVFRVAVRRLAKNLHCSRLHSPRVIDSRLLRRTLRVRPHANKQKEKSRFCDSFLFGDPDGIRTRVTAVKGRCLRPLDHRAILVAVIGLEPMTLRV